MDYGEITRQYQASLEHLRRARTELDGIVSMSDELNRIEAEHAREEARLADAWMALQGVGL